MDTSKGFAVIIVSTVLTAVNAIVLPVALYVFLFGFDVLFGIIADRIVNRRGFSTKKFLRAIVLLLCYSTVNFIVASICYFTEAHHHVDNLIRAITIVCSIFYAQNIFKNMTKTYPEARFFKFMYWLVSFEIVSEIPFLKKFMEAEKTDKDKGKDEDNSKKDSETT